MAKGKGQLEVWFSDAAQIELHGVWPWNAASFGLKRANNYEYAVNKSESWFLDHLIDYYLKLLSYNRQGQPVFQQVAKNDPSAPWALTPIGITVTASAVDPYGQ